VAAAAGATEGPLGILGEAGATSFRLMVAAATTVTVAAVAGRPALPILNQHKLHTSTASLLHVAISQTRLKHA